MSAHSFPRIDARSATGASPIALAPATVNDKRERILDAAVQVFALRGFFQSRVSDIAKEAGVRLLVLTHFSQRYTSTAPFLEEARAIFPHVVVAKDTKRYGVPKRDEPQDEDPAVATGGA